jgi:hypothetical protein
MHCYTMLFQGDTAYCLPMITGMSLLLTVIEIVFILYRVMCEHFVVEMHLWALFSFQNKQKLFS